MTTFFGILTKVGEAKEANAKALGVPVLIAELEVGDGGGVSPTPDREQTALIGPKRRAQINRSFVDPSNPAWLVIEQVIPEQVGGWWIRELGLRDADGDLIAVANCPPTYKPQLAEGSARTQVVRMVLQVSSSKDFTLKVDPSVVLATRGYVDAGLLQKLDKDGTAVAAVKLANARKISASGAATADAVEFDGTKDIVLPLKELDAGKTTKGFLPVAHGGTGQGFPGLNKFFIGNGVGSMTALDFYEAIADLLDSRNATQVLTGLVALANADETIAGQNDTKAITPLGLSYLTSTAGRRGLIRLASMAEVLAGQDTANAITAATLAALTATSARRGLIQIATAAEVLVGNETLKAVTPATIPQLFPIRGHRFYNSAGVHQVPVPNGVTRFRVLLAGAGGGGGGAYANAGKGAVGGGGGGGASACALIDVSGMPFVTLTIGAGGAGGVAQNSGAPGAASSFGAFLSVSGGLGGGAGIDGSANGGAGAASAAGADYAITGGAGGFGSVRDGVYAIAGLGGNTVLGTNNTAPNLTGSSNAGVNGGSGYNGAGGSGGAAFGATAAGGKGGDGAALIEW